MNADLFRAMYGYILVKAQGEGTRGGKVIGHTPAGKPIYASEGKTTGGPSQRKPYPGEEAHKLTTKQPEAKAPQDSKPKPPNEVQKRKTFMPPDNTKEGRYDPPNLKAYKTLLQAFKKQDVDFMGHISYDPKADQIIAISDEGPSLMRQVYHNLMASLNNKPKP